MTNLDRGDLSAYLDAAIASVKSARNASPDGLVFVQRVNNCFQNICAKSFDSMPAFAATLCLHSHSMFLAGAFIALSGHSAAAYSIMRACLESALYSLHIAKHPELAAVWADRRQSREAQQMCRENFSAGKVLATASVANPRLGAIVREVYEELIAFGAHPNAVGVLKNFQVTEGPMGARLEMAYLHDEGAAKYEPLGAGMEVAIYAMAMILAGFRDGAKNQALVAEVQAMINLGQHHSKPIEP